MSVRYELLVEGFLDVKTPPDSPERILNKAWRRQWVSATAVVPVGYRGEPHLTLLISRTKEDQQFSKKHIKASRDGLKLFRCRSGSRPLKTWGMSSGSTLLLYLAARTEEDSQIWMSRIRNGMWPPIMVAPALNQPDYTPEVSLIEDERSFTSGLVGAYGRLVQTSEDVLCLVHPHWQGTQMRWKLKDVLDVRFVRTSGKESSEAGVFQITVRSYKDDTRTLTFYSDTVVKTIDWIRCVVHGSKKEQRAVNIDSTTSIEPDKANGIPDATLEYAVIQKRQGAEKSKPTESDHSGKTEKEVQFNETWAYLNIPEAFLDASLSPTTFAQAKEHNSNEFLSENGKPNTKESDEPESDDSPGEMFEHLYENIADSQTKETRSYTVYEEVFEEPGEYVPPMPPSLPERPPTINKQISASTASQNSGKTQKMTSAMSQDPSALRLQKLCESVTEALKIAEETPEPRSISPKRKSQKSKKGSKALVKHHSLKSSPKMRMKKSEVSQSNESHGDLKRRVSDSEINISTKECVKMNGLIEL